jgi:hypothetical protein
MARCREILERAGRCDAMRNDRGWKLAVSVGIPRCGCCLHNAANDKEMRGWCAGNPARHKAAKRANRLVTTWPAAEIAERIVARIMSEGATR